MGTLQSRGSYACLESSGPYDESAVVSVISTFQRQALFFHGIACNIFSGAPSPPMIPVLLEMPETDSKLAYTKRFIGQSS